jgi:pimeloyl-ACP methyl ester carboxylesterase
MPIHNFDRYELSYDIYGEGETALLFIHGLGGNGLVWKYQIEYFRDRFMVVTIDLFGHGKSSKDVDPLFVPELDAAAIINLMQNKIKRPYFAIGHSFAGDVLPEMIRLNDPNLRGMVFVDCAYQNNETIIEGRIKFGEMKLSIPASQIEAETEKWYLDMLGATPDISEAEFVLLSLKDCDSRWLYKSVIGCREREKKHPHRETPIPDNLPVMIIEAGYGIGMEIEKSWVNHFKTAEYYLFERGYHFMFVTERDKFNFVLNRFIEERQIL